MSVQGGAGFNLAGMDLGAGMDAFAFTLPPSLPLLPPAVNYDASIKAFTQNADGTFLAIHPVDQIVQTRLTIPQGKIPALGSTGARYAARLFGVPQAQRQSVARDETKVALADLLANGDITLKRVSVLSSGPNQDFIQVVYVNNRLPAPASTETTTVTTPLTTG